MNGNGSMAFDWSWIVALLIIAGIFGNGFGWGGNRGNVANDTLLGEEFIKRDIFNTNQNVSATSCQTQRDVLENRFNCSQNACAIQKEILQNRYDTSLGLANVNKDILLGNNTSDVEVEDITLENYRITFGKYSGRTLLEIREEDPGYIRWMKQKIDDEPIKSLLAQM